MIAGTQRRSPQNRKLGHDRICRRRIADIRPSPENSKLYRPVAPQDPEVIALAKSIKKHGVQEPLVVTADRYILSGHRRHVAAAVAGLKTVPVRVCSVRRDKQPDRFLTLLREYNRQRVKSRDEQFREEIVSADPEEAYQSLIAHRREQSVVVADTIAIREQKVRAAISKAKAPFLLAIQRVLEKYRQFWPLSVRQIHYPLLNDPPLKHASKPDSLYRNDRRSYQSLDELLTRARLDELIPWEAIADETRPVVTWNVHAEVQGFLRTQLDGFLKGYWRNLVQSQPNHVEIVGEKNTIGSIIRPVAAEYCIPMTLGRGYCSLPPRHEMAKRFRESGKESLIILILSDFDPDGEEIAHSFARSMRDDFGVWDIEPIKVALTADQVVDFELPPRMKAKEHATGRERFVKKHGSDNVFELEAISPEDLQTVLRDVIDSVIDVEAFNHEIDQEKEDAAYLEAARKSVHKYLAERTMKGRPNNG